MLNVHCALVFAGKFSRDDRSLNNATQFLKSEAERSNLRKKRLLLWNFPRIGSEQTGCLEDERQWGIFICVQCLRYSELRPSDRQKALLKLGEVLH